MSLVAGLLCASWTTAQSASDSWQLALTPYLVGAGISGELTVGERGRAFEVSARDLLSSLDFALMVNVEARKRAWAVSGDLFYADLGKETDSVSPGPGAGLGPFSADVGQVILAGDVGYELTEGLDVLAGARGVSVSSTLRGQRGTIAESDSGWVDPFVGARYRRELGDRFRLRVRGDVGGFGVGSEIAFFASAAVAYRANDWLSLALGYRLWDFDRDSEDTSTTFDAAISGFGAGLSLHF